MPDRKIIKFRNRNPGTKEKLLSAINGLKKDVEDDVYTDICLVWRKNIVSEDNEDKTEHWLTDYIWYSKTDRLAITGLLTYIIRKVMKLYENGDKPN